MCNVGCALLHLLTAVQVAVQLGHVVSGVEDRHLVRQGSALAHWAAGAVKANAERQLERALYRHTHTRLCRQIHR